MQGVQQWYMAIGGHQVGPVSQDEILTNLTNLGTQVGVTCEKEIVSEFRQLLPADRQQEAIDRRVEGHRPDFKAHLPSRDDEGEWTTELTARWYEQKLIHSGTRYSAGPSGTKAVEADGGAHAKVEKV